MSFLGKFKRSALELKTLRCIVLTGILIGLDIVLKMFSIKLTADLKVTFAFVAIAAIGMLFGPTVAFLAGTITDIIGFMMNPDGGFSPLFTLIEAVGAMIYGLFLYEMKPVFSFRDNKIKRTSGTVLKDILISLGVGVAVGGVVFLISFIIWSTVSNMGDAEGNTGKLIKVLADVVIVYASTIAGFLYGVLFTLIIRLNKDGLGEIGSTLRIVFSKITVVVVCNLIMTPIAMILSGYTTLDSTLAGYPLRLIKNGIQCPVDCLILLFMLSPILVAYKKVFRDNTNNKGSLKQNPETV